LRIRSRPVMHRHLKRRKPPTQDIPPVIEQQGCER
jgi:hypothetical protein